MNTGVGSLSLLPGDLSDPGIKPGSPALQADSLPAEPQGKPKNTGVGSLSLLPAELPEPAIKLGSPASRADSFPVELSGNLSISGPNFKISYSCFKKVPSLIRGVLQRF